MIDYETYKRKFGTKDKRSNEYIIGISQDIYDMLSQESRLGIAFQNEITLALTEDIIIAIGACMMNEDKDKRLKSWKRLGDVIKRILIKHRKDDNSLNDRFYSMSASPGERDFFIENPIAKNNISSNISNIIGGLSKFYRAMSTDVGTAVYQAIINEKKKEIGALYDNKTVRNNGTSSYYNILNFVLNNWSRRIEMYESYSKSLKLINRGIRDVRVR
jgi:hypothetical protein